MQDLSSKFKLSSIIFEQRYARMPKVEHLIRPTATVNVLKFHPTGVRIGMKYDINEHARLSLFQDELFQVIENGSHLFGNTNDGSTIANRGLLSAIKYTKGSFGYIHDYVDVCPMQMTMYDVVCHDDYGDIQGIKDDLMIRMAMDMGSNIVFMIPKLQRLFVVSPFMGDSFQCYMIDDVKDKICDMHILNDDDLNNDCHANSLFGCGVYECTPNWDVVRMFAFGESMWNDDEVGAMLRDVITLTMYDTNERVVLQWQYQRARSMGISFGDLVPTYTRDGRLDGFVECGIRANRESNSRGVTTDNLLAHVKGGATMLYDDRTRYGMYLTDKRAKRLNACMVPRPRSDLWLNNEVIEQFMSRTPSASLGQGEPPRMYTARQFHPYTSGGYDIVNNRIRAETDMSQLISGLSWKVYGISMRKASSIVRCCVVGLKSSWFYNQDGVIRQHVNKYVDVGFDVNIAFDSHYQAEFLIIQARGIERVHPLAWQTDVYRIHKNNGLNSFTLVERVGLTSNNLGLLDQLRHMEEKGLVSGEGTVTDQIMTSVDRTEAAIRRKVIDWARQKSRLEPNNRIMQRMSDTNLLMRYKFVPTLSIASKLKRELCMVIDRSCLSTHKPELIYGTYCDRTEFFADVTPAIRDSVAMKLNVKHDTSMAEKSATIEDAKKWCTSYTLQCKTNERTDYKVKVRRDGTICLPCGFITTKDNTMINKHSCCIKLMGTCPSVFQDVVKLRIHGAFMCNKCNMVYQSNISALMCALHCM